MMPFQPVSRFFPHWRVRISYFEEALNGIKQIIVIGVMSSAWITWAELIHAQVKLVSIAAQVIDVENCGKCWLYKHAVMHRDAIQPQ